MSISRKLKRAGRGVKRAAKKAKPVLKVVATIAVDAAITLLPGSPVVKVALRAAKTIL